MPKKTRFYQRKSFWAWFILITMVMSTAGVVVNYRTNDSTKPKEYKDLKFYQTESGYMTILKSEQFFFSHFPGDLETIPAEFNLNLNSEKIYFVFNPDDDLRFDTSMNRLGSVFYNMNLRPVRACIQEEGCPDIPVTNCEESTPKFYFKEFNVTQIYTDGNCTVVNAGSREEMQKAVERIYFKILGIMD